METFFYKGIIIGLCLSLPFGPIGIYCMEKTLSEGKEAGYAAAMGMVTIDFVYGVVSFLFINQIEDEIHRYGPYLTTLIGIFLCYIGAKKYFREVEAAHPKEKGDNFFQHYLTTFLFAIANVSTIITIIGIYTVTNKFLRVPLKLLNRLDGNHLSKVWASLVFASGILLGGAALWLLTTVILNHCKKQITHDVLVKITKYAGLIILLFGIATIISSLRKIF